MQLAIPSLKSIEFEIRREMVAIFVFMVRFVPLPRIRLLQFLCAQLVVEGRGPASAMFE